MKKQILLFLLNNDKSIKIFLEKTTRSSFILRTESFATKINQILNWFIIMQACMDIHMPTITKAQHALTNLKEKELPKAKSFCLSAFLESQQHRLVVFSSGNRTTRNND